MASAIVLAVLLLGLLAGMTRAATGDVFTIIASGDLSWQPSSGSLSQTASEPLSATGTFVGAAGSAPYEIAAFPGAVRGRVAGSHQMDPLHSYLFNPHLHVKSSVRTTISGPVPAGTQVSARLRLHVDGTMNLDCHSSCTMKAEVYATGRNVTWRTIVDRTGIPQNGLGLTIDTLPNGYRIHGDVVTPTFTASTGVPFDTVIGIELEQIALAGPVSTFDLDFRDGLTFAPTGPVFELPAGFDANATDLVHNHWTGGLPTASFTATPANADCGTSVAFDGSASRGAGPRAIEQYQWTFGDGVTQNTSDPMVDHAYATPGQFQPRLVVVDDQGTVGDPVSITTRSLDRTAPTAAISGPSTTDGNGDPSFDGSGSTDPGGTCGSDIVEYRWRLDGGTERVSTEPTVRLLQLVSEPTTGSHVLSLVVVDGSGNVSIPAQHALEIGGDVVPVAKLTVAPSSVACGKLVTLDGGGSTAAPGSAIRTYRFDLGAGSGPITSVDASIARAYDRLGRFTPSLVVIDDQGTESDPATSDVRVEDRGAPTAAIRPVADRYAGASITFDGSTSVDAEEACGSRLVAWRWQLDGGTVVETVDETIPSSALAAKLSLGDHTLSLVVVDDSDNVSIPATASFRILAQPVASVSATPLLPPCGQSTLLDGSASTADDALRLVSYHWHFGDGTSDVVTPDDAPRQSHTYASLGRYDATLVVVDSNGTQSSADGVTITLRDTHAPTAVISGPTALTAGQVVTFDGSASSDPDAACGSRIVSWRWHVDGGPVVDTTSPTISSGLLSSQLTLGSHTLHLVVIDDSGNESADATRSLNVTAATGTIVLAVDTAPDTTVAIGLVGPAPLGTTTLDGSPGTATPDNRTITGVTAGTYHVVQTATTKLGVVRIVCIDPDGGTTIDVGSRTSHIDLDGGETVSCTFTSISLASVAAAANGLQSLAFTPAAATSLLKGFGYTANQAGPAIANAYALDAGQTAPHLKAAGYSSTDITTTLKNGFGLSSSLATSVLKAIGYDSRTVAARLTDTYGRNPQQVGQLLKDAQYNETQVADALQNQLGQEAQQLANIYRQIGYGASTTLQRLKEGYGLQDQDAAQKELAAQYEVQQVVAALKTVAGKTAAEAAAIMNVASVGSVIVVAAIEAVFTVGFAQDVAAATVAAAMLAGGYTAAEVTVGLKTGMALGSATTITALRAAQVGADVAMGEVAAAFNKTPQQIAQLAKDAGYGPTQIASALRTRFQQDALQFATIFRQITFSAATTEQRLRVEYQLSVQAATEKLIAASFQLDAIVDALRTQESRTASQCANIVRLAQVGPIAAAAAIAAVFTIGFAQDVAAATVAGAMLGGGYVAAEVTVGLKTGLSASATITTAALWAANVGIPAIIDNVRTTYGRTLQQVIGYLRDAGVSEAELAAHLHDSEGKQMAEIASMLRLAGAGGDAVYVALRDEFLAGRDDLAEALDDGNFSNQAIADALKGPGGASIGETARIMRTVVVVSASICATVLVAAYAPAQAVAAETIAIALAGAGYTSAQVAPALQAIVGAGATAGALAMQAAGIANATIAGHLKSTWGMTAGPAAEILHEELNATSTEIATALKEKFGQSSTEMAGILEDLGYSATTVARRLDDVYGKGAAKAAEILKAVGYGSKDISEALRDAYDRTASQTAAILDDLGYSLETIVRRLEDVFDEGVDSIKSILTGLDFSLTDILAAIAAVFG